MTEIIIDSAAAKHRQLYGGSTPGYRYCCSSPSSPMIQTAFYRSYRSCRSAPVRRAYYVDTTRTRRLSTSPKRRGKDVSMPTTPPKHQMVYLPELVSKTREWGVFRKVLHTGLYSQLVALEVPVNGELGDEVHSVDQILIFTSGRGRATVAGKDQDVKAGDVVVVPAGTQHQFITVGDRPLELVTVHSPAQHDSQTVHRTKEEGDQDEEEGRDEAPEWSRRSKRENEDRGLVSLAGGPYDDE